MKKFLLISLITIFSTLNASVLNQQDSSATFSIKKYANTVTVNGEFESFKGEVKVDDDKNLLFFKGEAYVSSIKTDDAKRDSELKSQKYLDEQNYPKIKIQTISIQNNIAHVKVDIKGISKEFEWKITKETINEKLFFTINGELNRLDFGVGEKSFLISNQLKIAIKISII